MTDHHAMATRNESLCDQLLEEGEYYEWVVTTAFYSALHWVSHVAFPFEVRDQSGNARRIANIQQFKTFKEGSHPKFRNMSLHASMKQLIREYHGTIRRPYKKLFDECHRARYRDHRVSESQARHIRTQLEQVVEYGKKVAGSRDEDSGTS